jgi:hypothetical protein
MHSPGMLAFGLVLASAAPVAAGPAPAQQQALPGPCDGLVAYLHSAIAGRVPTLALPRGPSYEGQESSLEGALSIRSDTTPRGFKDLVTPACRAATRRAAAPEAVAAARALTQRSEPGWVDRGRILLCSMQDPASLGEVAAWIDDPTSLAAKAVCASELVSWPGAEPLRDPSFTRALRRRALGWELDPAIVAAANAMGSPELREQLLPILAMANAHHALGYDRLRDGVCKDDGAMSNERTAACSTLPVEAEVDWPQREPGRRWLAKGTATAIFAGAVTAAAVEQHQEAGRVIAAAAGVPLGATLGLVGGAHDPSRVPESTRIKVDRAVGVVIGGAAGYAAAYALAAKPSSRATVTGLALAPLYLAAVVTFGTN